MGAELERRLRAACPAHADLELEAVAAGRAGVLPADDPTVRAAAAAIERATGTAPVMVRSGGSIPVMAALVGRGTPTVLSGFGTSEDNIHSPNESMSPAKSGVGVRCGARDLPRAGRTAAAR